MASHNRDIKAARDLAEAVRLAERALVEVPYGARAELDELLDQKVLPGDFDTLAAKITAIADAWEAEIEAHSPPAVHVVGSLRRVG